MITEWFRERKRKRSRQKAGERQEEDRREIGYSQVNNPIIIRIWYVYVTYILRIWYVNEKGKVRD